MKVFVDTSVLVAACIEEHVHHERGLAVLDAIHGGADEGFASGHAALEAYSTLTRMPRSPRILPAQARALIEENIVDGMTLVALTGREYGQLISRLGVEGTLGGQAYDALHLACAEKCGAERIYTFNVRHFQSLASTALRPRIVAP